MADDLHTTTTRSGDHVASVVVPVSGGTWRWQWTWSTAGATRTW